MIYSVDTIFLSVDLTNSSSCRTSGYAAVMSFVLNTDCFRVSNPPLLRPEYGFNIGGVSPGANSSLYDRYFDSGVTGFVDDVRIYDHALSQAELQLVYFGFAHDAQNAPTPLPPVQPAIHIVNDLSLANW